MMSEALTRFLAVEKQIEGWFNPSAAATWDCLLSFQKRMEVTGNTMEIGVWHGRSAGLLVMHTDTDSEMCLLVDRVVRREELDRTLGLLEHEPGPLLKYVGIPAETLATTDAVRKGALSFRFIHIDGEHSGVDVYRNLELADGLLARHGIICLDDFFSWRYPQITEATFDFINTHKHRFTMFLVGFNKAFLARPMWVHDYHEYCIQQLGGEMEERGFETSVAKTTWPADSKVIGIGPRYADTPIIGPDWCPQTVRV